MIKSIREFTDHHFTGRTLRNWVLVLLIFTTLANVLRDSIQGVENSLLVLMIVAGLFLGWMLAISNVVIWKTCLISFLSGGIILTIWVGRLWNLITSLFIQIIELSTQIWPWIFQDGQFPGSKTIELGIAELGSKTLTLVSRLATWIRNLLEGNPIFDPVATAYIWGFLVWLIAIWLVWLTVRTQKPLIGIIPVLALTGLSLIYTGKSAYNLIPMLGLMIGLVVMVRYDTHEALWRSENIKFASTIRARMLTFSFMLAIGLMVFAAISPSFSIRSIVDYINRITADTVDEDSLAHSLGLDPPPKLIDVSILDSQRRGGLPNRHLIGSGEELSDQLVMIVKVHELIDPDSDPADLPERTYYWRGLTYDQYFSQGWISSKSTNQDYTPGEKTLSDWPDNYRIIRQEVEFVEDLGGLLFTVGIPLSIDQPFQIAWRVQNSDHEAYDVFGASIQKNEYVADSLQGTGSKVELQAVGQEYPDWIRDRFLRLPDSVPDRVISLARDITATEPTPYDRAAAIESFLHEFPYTLDLAQPPQDQDITDYFLFSAKRGYCDYYATAMVVLSRAAGLPARLVTGYIGGYYVPSVDAYLITADLAHAWAEVYFPGYGWIIFEPTTNRPKIDRLADPIHKFSQDYASSFDPLVPEKTPLSLNWWPIIFAVLLFTPLVWFTALLLDDLILKHLPGEKQLPRIYRRIYRYAHRIGHSSLPGDTIYEFVDKLILSINKYGEGSKEAEWLFSAADQLREITRSYYLVLYSPDGSSKINSRETALIYRTLRIRMWYLWLLVRAYPFWLLRNFLWDSAPKISSLKPTQL